MRLAVSVGIALFVAAAWLAPGAAADGATSGVGRPPTGPVTLLGDGIGSARFGQAQPAAVAGLDRALGPPRTPAVIAEPGNCTIDAALDWVWVTAYFYHRHFVGYSTGYAGGPTRVRPNVVTERGLRIGDTLRQLRRLYGGALRTSYAQGGSWFVTTPSGTLDGVLTSEITSKNPVPRILTIDAGSVGCPAVSP
jgi:hypothetical protein